MHTDEFSIIIIRVIRNSKFDFNKFMLLLDENLSIPNITNEIKSIIIYVIIESIHRYVKI